MTAENKPVIQNVRSAHLSDIAGKTGFLFAEKDSRSLMESYWGRIAQDQRVPSLRLAWQDLWAKACLYMSKEDMKTIGETFVFSSVAHEKQKRHTGEPYIVHTVSVATILAGMGLDRDTINAALLHDVLEDTEVGDKEFEERFGSDVFNLVDGVTKLGKLQFESVKAYQSENLRKLIIGMAKDIRVVLIKLADRIHNMRTISSHKRMKQESISHETMEIYAPLASRLGIYQMKRELEDLSFKMLKPEMYYDIKRRVRKMLPERESVIKEAIDVLTRRLKNEKIEFSIKGRSKHLYSIYEKMRRKNLAVEQLFDLLALRVVVNTIGECYQIMGVVHTLWNPIPGQFDDYIANPKSNMYQSLHTTVIGPKGAPLEVQIRTKDMNLLAEYGIAAHWNYKEGGHKVDTLDKKLAEIRMDLEDFIQRTEKEKENTDKNDEGTSFIENFKTDVLPNSIAVRTPQGRVISLPPGATPIDFAFGVHTEIGYKCAGAKVNGIVVPLDRELKNYDCVEILTSSQAKPSRDWLNTAKANRTRNKIRAWFKQQEKEERETKLEKGTDLLTKELAKRNPGKKDGIESLSTQLAHIAREIGYTSLDEMIIAVASGNHSAASILGRLPKEQKKNDATDTNTKAKEKDSAIIVEGADNVLVTLAKCCHPVPGDAITGVTTQSRGISIHRNGCASLKKSAESRRVAVAWGRQKDSSWYLTRVKVEGVKKPSLVSDVKLAITQTDGKIKEMRQSNRDNSHTFISLDLLVKDTGHINRIVKRLYNISEVQEVLGGREDNESTSPKGN
ncbi:MAG: bifunctional (p)ppGpp synthetase/guanosine-3',5'-bis(diphosphate) 3'-pyrophosphohydrolase [Synergistes sp.]|nr:bifunctional (p)ppGpp synthetase/guanosine-3',5'-bis(diphosphate) 3'-pyrophosphohydrolase [Synergistes sp.]